MKEIRKSYLLAEWQGKGNLLRLYGEVEQYPDRTRKVRASVHKVYNADQSITGVERQSPLANVQAGIKNSSLIVVGKGRRPTGSLALPIEAEKSARKGFAELWALCK
jgi:hypothetical protein